MKPTKTPSWQANHVLTPTHEGEFLQEQMQRLLRKALVTIETTLNDHNLPSTDRLDASLKIIALFQGSQDPGHSMSAEEQQTVESDDNSVHYSREKLSKEEIVELDELRAVL